MSNVSSVHNIKEYVIGVTKPFTGQRLAKVTYKVDKSTGIKPESVCVSVPPISQDDVMNSFEQFIPHLLGMIERTQDNMIRVIHESKCSVVQDDDISIARVLEFLNEESSGGRITKKDAIEWFNNTLEDPLTLALSAKLGVSEEPSKEESDKVTKLVEEFKNNISALTAGNVKYNPDVCTVLAKALSFAPVEDQMRVRFEKRLDNMMNKVHSSIADAL